MHDKPTRRQMFWQTKFSWLIMIVCLITFSVLIVITYRHAAFLKPYEDWMPIWWSCYILISIIPLALAGISIRALNPDTMDHGIPLKRERKARSTIRFCAAFFLAFVALFVGTEYGAGTSCKPGNILVDISPEGTTTFCSRESEEKTLQQIEVPLVNSYTNETGAYLIAYTNSARAAEHIRHRDETFDELSRVTSDAHQKALYWLEDTQGDTVVFPLNQFADPKVRLNLIREFDQKLARQTVKFANQDLLKSPGMDDILLSLPTPPPQ